MSRTQPDVTGLEIEEGATSQGVWAASKAGNDKGMDSLIELKGNTALQTLSFAQ